MLESVSRFVEEIIPIESYNATEAKLIASISWIITRIFGNNIPDVLLVPYYTDDQNRIHLKPSTINSIISGELYCSAAANIFRDMGFLNQNHTTVLHALKRCGIEVVEENKNHVTETVLTQAAPFKMGAHLAMIDGLMAANVREFSSIDRIVDAVKKYSKSEFEEIPCNVEDAFTLWINTICAAVRKKLYIKKDSVENGAQLVVPEISELFEDICDGTCLATLLSFYSNQELPLSAICFKDRMSIADCLHNLQLVKKFCLKNFQPKIYHFSNYEDILYTHDTLKININAFLADLFYRLESTNDVKSSVGLSASKRHFDRVSIPDLRPFEKDTISRAQVSRPSKLAHHGSLSYKGASVTPSHTSFDASLHNSTDSLMTQRSIDSLMYTPHCNPSGDSYEIIGTPVTFADHARRTESSGADISADDSTNKLPPWSIKMQLDEKKRQIELQRLQDKSERIQLDQATSKEAFLKLIGKSSQSPATVGKSCENMTDSLATVSPTVTKRPTSSNNHTIDEQSTVIQQESTKCLTSESETTVILRNPPPDFSNDDKQKSTVTQSEKITADVICEISSSIKEIRQQMKQLAAEQQQIQRMLASSGKIPAELHDFTSAPLQPVPLSPAQGSPQIFQPPAALHHQDSTLGDSIMTSSIVDEQTIDPENGEIFMTQSMLLGGPSAVFRASSQQGVSPGRRSLSPNNVGFVVGEDKTDDDLYKKREIMVASALKRKALLEKRKDEIEDEFSRKQEEVVKKEEQEKQRKKEKELHRMRIFDEFQKRKAEKEATDQATIGTRKMAPTLSLSRLNSSHHARHRPSHRPMSQVLPEKQPSCSKTMTSSVDDIDQIDNKSQSSDGYGSISVFNQPSIRPFAKPTPKSNRSLIFNALEYSVFAGEVNKEKKLKCLQELAKSDSKHFLVLFRDQKCQFRGMYKWDQMSTSVQKIYGLGPSSCPERYLQHLFKYDSGLKKFLEIPARHFSANTDGFSIGEEFWQKMRQPYTKSSTMTS